MADPQSEFTVSLAQSEAELRAAQSLRYEVFVQEMGADGVLVDHQNGLEIDQFDAFCDHMLITETATGRVIGVYRLMRSDQAQRAGRFYSEAEYDLSALRASGRRLLELGRSCLHPDFRGGKALFHLWSGLSAYVEAHQIEVLFGVASFAGTDLEALSGPLTVLHQDYLAPEALRCRSHRYQRMNLMPPDKVDRRRAMIDCPALIKAYLRLGGRVGDGAYIDRDFNTTDVCMILDTTRMTGRQKRIYSGSKVEGQG